VYQRSAVTHKLVALEGPLKGSTFSFTGESFSIGRKPDNTISPVDLSISRRHCVIRVEDGHCRLTDLDSQNGTMVNGIQVHERLLEHGDQITVGVSVFVFLEDAAGDASGSTIVTPRAPARVERGPLHHQMLGESAAIRQVLDFLARAAPLESTVLLTGESGTGKELAARALHENSPRAEHPYVAINCAVLTETFLESELFGHERGAFTGAIAQKRGKLELAEGGTLFLDEIGELAAPLQAKLLRVLQEREYQRLGGTRTMKADVRVVAATNRDLAAAAKEGKFRHDLYFRLRVLSVEMPSLRQRREDIPLLANHFRIQQSAKLKRSVLGIAPAAKECLMRYDWPGNVRELESAIESAIALGSTELILPEDLPDNVLGTAATEELPRFNQAMADAKRELIRKAYRDAGGDYICAAKTLGLHPNSLLRLVRTLGLKEEVH
jgi:transcriptional regulator with PAS, ATPase and Fis domain